MESMSVANQARTPQTDRDDLLRKQLEQDLDRTMHHRYAVEVPAATGYRPTRMVDMIHRYGGLVTIRRLMVQYAGFPSEGYTHLWEYGRLELSFEALMLHPRFAPLFTEAERRWACQRLSEYGYMPPSGCP
jgi:hypothetical protein